ncbi:uncharacterized protein G2W53_024867 [Senna tora]|uniref:Uncharacterized protein n=1 Tax=Senna tora TaxID=362788 RepID=A0A834WE79_9FABA|nr:uncharacterized protein G2W53_024867 [Senna tora]
MIARATQWRRARKESMMLLSVTSMEGVGDSTSYVVATSKEGVNDAASGDKHERFQLHARKESTMALSKVPVTCAEGVIDDIKCEQQQQGRVRGCIEGFDDGATEDSDNHVKLLPCSDIPPCDNKEMLKVILSVDSSLKTKQDGILCVLKDALTECAFVRWGGDDQHWMLGMSKGRRILSFRAFFALFTLRMDATVFLCLLDQLMSAFSMAASHSNAKSYAVRCLTRSKYIMCTIGPPWSHTLALLVLEWRSLAISLLMLAMKFSICGGRIICLQQVGASRNIPSKALIGSSRSIEGSWFFFGFFVSSATTSLRACWFLTMLSIRVKEMMSWLLATSSFVLACPS